MAIDAEFKIFTGVDAREAIIRKRVQEARSPRKETKIELTV